MPGDGVGARSTLERGRRSYAARAWLDAYASLSAADGAMSLGPRDLELLATSAYLVGRDDELLRALERAHCAYLADGDRLPAVRSAFWLGIHLTIRGEMGRATGWLARARRLVGREEHDCVERGYLASASAFHHLHAGRWDEARADAARAAELGDHHGDPDLVAIGLIDEGRALAALGRVREGLALLDEAMVAVTTGELSPIVSGFVYCSVIEGCHEVYDLRRAAEWTHALTRGVIGIWGPVEPEEERFTRWVRAAWSRLRPFSTAGNYVNFQTADEGRVGIEEAYGANLDRLVALKRRYDPDNLFRVNRNVAVCLDRPPSGSRSGRHRCRVAAGLISLT